MRLNGKKIVKEGFASEDAAERITDAIVTFCQGRYKSRIKKLAADRPEECQIVAENTDGSRINFT